MEGPANATLSAVERCSAMTRTRWLLHQGRVLEVRQRRVVTTFQIWIYEDGQPVGLHSTVRLVDASAGLARGVDLVSRAMADAVADALQGRFSLDGVPPMPAPEYRMALKPKPRN